MGVNLFSLQYVGNIAAITVFIFKGKQRSVNSESVGNTVLSAVTAVAGGYRCICFCVGAFVRIICKPGKRVEVGICSIAIKDLFITLCSGTSRIRRKTVVSAIGAVLKIDRLIYPGTYNIYINYFYGEYCFT